jgi:hypothetical protein
MLHHPIDNLLVLLVLVLYQLVELRRLQQVLDKVVDQQTRSSVSVSANDIGLVLSGPVVVVVFDRALLFLCECAPLLEALAFDLVVDLHVGAIATSTITSVATVTTTSHCDVKLMWTVSALEFIHFIASSCSATSQQSP